VRGPTLFTRLRRTRCHSFNRKPITGQMSSALPAVPIGFSFDFNLKLCLDFCMVGTAPRRNRNLPLGDSLTIAKRIYAWATGLGLLGWGSALEILASVIQVAILLVVEVPGANRRTIHFLLASRFAPEALLRSFDDIPGFYSIHNWIKFKEIILGLLLLLCNHILSTSYWNSLWYYFPSYLIDSNRMIFSVLAYWYQCYSLYCL